MWWLEKGCQTQGKFYSRPGSSSMAGLILEVRFVKNFASFQILLILLHRMVPCGYKMIYPCNLIISLGPNSLMLSG